MISARDRVRERVDAVRSRDAFLEVVAQKFDERVTGACALGSELRGNRSTRKLQAALEDLAGFVRELRMIAMPHEAMTMRRRKLDLAALITATFEEQRKRLAAAQVTVEVRRSGSVSGRWDRGHLMTIFLELMSNAVKYSDGGAVSVRLTVTRGTASLVIENDGAWVGPRRGFDRFRRGESRENVPGCGVGLWLTRRLAEANGGALRISSRAGKTRVAVHLPCDARAGDGERVLVRVQGLQRLSYPVRKRQRARRATVVRRAATSARASGTTSRRSMS